MSSALGGLLDRALNNLLCSKANSLGQSGQDGVSELSSGTIDILSKLCAVRRKKAAVDALRGLQSKTEKSGTVLANELRQLMQKCGKIKSDSKNSTPQPRSALDHFALALATDQEQRSYPCPVCDDRFALLSTRNRHMAQVHTQFNKRNRRVAKDQETSEQEDSSDSTDNVLEQDWRDAPGPSYDSDGEGGGQKSTVRPICSDCGLSFANIQELTKHRRELHPRQTIKGHIDLPVSENVVDSTSGEGRTRSRRCAKTSAKQSLVGQVGSSKQTVRCRRKQKGACVGKNIEQPDSLKSKQVTPNTKKSPGVSRLLDKTKSDVAAKAGNQQSSEIEASTKTTVTENKLAMRKRMERKNVRFLGGLDNEDVRVKAEAALRELNLIKKNKSLGPSKWGIESLRFTKQNPTEHFKTAEEALSSVNFTRAKYAMMMAEKKCSRSSNPVGNAVKPDAQIQVKTESDVYDFNDDELSTNSNKVTLPYGQKKDERYKNQDNNEKWVFYKDDVELSLDS